MHWLMLLVLAFGPEMSADRIRAIGRLNEAIKARTEHDDQQAMRLAKEAIELDPSYVRAHFTLGRMHQDAGRLVDAAEAFRKGLKIVPKGDELAADLAYSLGAALEGRSDEAGVTAKTRTELRREGIVAYSTAIEADPGHYRSHYGRGRLHDVLEDPDAADADFRRCIRLQPQYARCFSALAFLYLDYGFEKEALAVLDAGLKANAKDATMWSAAARVHLEMKQPEEAVAAFKKAKAIDPDMIEVLYGLGMAYADLRRTDKAIETLTEFLARAGSDVPETRKRAANDTIARMQDVF